MIALVSLRKGSRDFATVNVGAASGNFLIKWLGLTDRDGGEVAKYRLMLDPSPLNALHNLVYQGWAEFGYAAFVTIASFGQSLTNWILEPQKWLAPAESFYSEITAAVFSKVPPAAIALIALVVLIGDIFLRRGPAGSMVQVSSGQWRRLGAGLFVFVAILIAEKNPIGILRNVFEAVSTFTSALTLTNASGGAGDYVASRDLDMMRSVTFLINYHDMLTPTCARSWSDSINHAGGNPGCLTPDQLAATDPDIYTALTAFPGAPAIALAFLFFAVVLGIRMFNHASLFLVYFFGTLYAAAMSLGRRRPYDPPKRALSRAATHVFFLLVFLALGQIVRAGLTRLIFAVLPDDVPIFVHATVLAALTAGAGYLILAMSRKQESVLSLFRERISGHSFWNTLHPGGPQSPLSKAADGAFDKPRKWVTDQYQSARSTVTNGWKQFREGQGPQPEGANVRNILPAETIVDMATEQFSLKNEADVSAAPVIIDPTSAAPPEIIAAPTATKEEPELVAVKTADGIIAGRPVDPGQPFNQTGPTDVPAVWFSAGVPQLVPPTIGPAVPAPAPQPAEPKHAAPDEPATPRLSYTEMLRSEATALRRSQGENVDPVDEATKAMHRNVQANQRHRTAPASAPVDIAPRGILDSAQWTQRLNHYRNMLAAKGINARVSLPDDPATWEEFMFTTTADGRNIVEPKYGLGFGDKI